MTKFLDDIDIVLKLSSDKTLKLCVNHRIARNFRQRASYAQKYTALVVFSSFGHQNKRWIRIVQTYSTENRWQENRVGISSFPDRIKCSYLFVLTKPRQKWTSSSAMEHRQHPRVRIMIFLMDFFEFYNFVWISPNRAIITLFQDAGRFHLLLRYSETFCGSKKLNLERK